MTARNPNAAPARTRKALAAELRSVGFRKGATDVYIAWAFEMDEESLGESTCDCGRVGLAAECYCRGRPSEHTRPEYQCLYWCPDCGQADLL